MIAKLLSKISEKPSGRLSYSQEGEDMILADLLTDRDSGFYVDVGAYHPVRFSNTKFFYDRGWSGVNIEPSPDVINEFHRMRPRDQNLNVGISHKEGNLPYFMFAEAALNTFDPKRVATLGKETVYTSNRTALVPVRRLDSVLAEAKVPERIDFMNIDVEWHEMEVLRSNDWSKYRPAILMVEILDFELKTILRNPIHKFLEENGYRFECKTPRTCFYRNTRSK